MIKQLTSAGLLTLLMILCSLEATPTASVWIVVGQGVAIIATLVTLIAIQQNEVNNHEAQGKEN